MENQNENGNSNRKDPINTDHQKNIMKIIMVIMDQGHDDDDGECFLFISFSLLTGAHSFSKDRRWN